MGKKAVVPETALRVVYRHHGHKLLYYVWPARDPAWRGWWCWHASGMEGMSVTQELAQAAARRWIKTGQ